MPEKLRFPSEAEKKEEKILEELKEKGGIFYSETTDLETQERKAIINILGVELETYASKEDIEVIKKEIILSGVDQDLLRAIADSYRLREPLMLEADPGAGKTFLMKKFVNLIHGKDAPILELNGAPRTSELEILGHWAPKGFTEEEAEKYKEVLRVLMGSDKSDDLRTQLEQELSQLSQMFQSEQISQEEFNDKFGEVSTRYINESRNLVLGAAQLEKFIKPEAEWEFKEGALLQAYSGREGKGYILIVDEFNLIPSNYQQIFLQIGGEKGALSESISFWGNTGKTVYPRGKDTMLFFASNFPEKTPGRSEVVAPMTDRLVWKTLTAEETSQKKEVIKRTAGGRLKKRLKEVFKLRPEIPAKEQLSWAEVLDEELGEQIADVVDMLDKEFVKNYEAVGDSVIIKGEARRRMQQMEFSGRNPLRVFSYLDSFQVRNPETGLIDFTATLKNAFGCYYLDRLVNSEAREKMDALFNEILVGVTGKVNFEGEIKTRKEIFDLLVERASLTEEEKKKKEEELKEKEKGGIKQLMRDTEDAREKIFKNPKIPQAVKDILSS